MKPEDYVNRVIERCESTNDLARALGEEGFEHGSWVSAREQLRGRGRLGREWESLEGNLFLSLLARPDAIGVERAAWTWIPLAVAVGVVESLAGLFPQADLRAKWPNDLWVGIGAAGSKVGGILCEAVSQGDKGFVVVGIGLNCLELPDVPDQRATSLTAALGRRVAADDVRGAVTRGVLAGLQRLGRDGPAAIARAFETHAALPRGARVQWGAGLEGQVDGLGESGELVVRTARTGELVRLYAEDVKLRLA